MLTFNSLYVAWLFFLSLFCLIVITKSSRPMLVLPTSPLYHDTVSSYVTQLGLGRRDLSRSIFVRPLSHWMDNRHILHVGSYSRDVRHHPHHPVETRTKRQRQDDPEALRGMGQLLPWWRWKRCKRGTSRWIGRRTYP